MSYVAEKGREFAVGGIKGLLKRLWDESKPGVNRFRYDAGNVRLFGRDDELAFLWEFCHSDVHFSWFAISGEGGSGKTRLAYTLGELLKYEPEWSYRKVDYARPDGLADAKQALKDAPQNTLLVLDYVKWHTDSIGKWLYDLWCDWHERNLKIRVLLVERDAISPLDLRWQHDVMAAQYRPATDAPFLDDNNLMRLRPLNDDDMISVVNDYAAAFDAQVDASLIIETLKKIDPELRRPLYALFVTDAYLVGNDLRTWDRESALEYVYLKERERILLNADSLPTKLQGSVFRALLVATLSGGIEYKKFTEFMPGEATMLQEYAAKDYSTAPEFLADCLGLSYDKSESMRISPLEPDLMGEFFCIQELWHLNDKQRQETVGLTMLNDLRRAAVVFDRIAHDYAQLLTRMEMSNLFIEIMLPNSIKEISECTFFDCTSLKTIFAPAVKSVGGQAFWGCTSLISVSLPLAESIGMWTFFDCTSLVTVSLPAVKSIGERSFYKCTNLTTISLPVAEIIGVCAFPDCISLTDISLPSAKSIEEGAFLACTGLSSICIPAIKSIEHWSFSDCGNLKKIYLSDAVKYIDEAAFSCCTSLRDVYIYGNLTVAIRVAFWRRSVIFHGLPKEAAATCISPPDAV